MLSSQPSSMLTAQPHHQLALVSDMKQFLLGKVGKLGSDEEYIVSNGSNNSHHWEGKSFSELVKIILDHVSLFSDSDIQRLVIPYIILYKKKKKETSLVERFCYLVEAICSHRHFPIIISNLLIPLLSERDFYEYCLKDGFEGSKLSTSNIEHESLVKVLTTLHEKVTTLYYANDSGNLTQNNNNEESKKNSLIVELLDQASQTTVFRENEWKKENVYARTNSSLWRLPTFFKSELYIKHIILSLDFTATHNGRFQEGNSNSLNISTQSSLHSYNITLLSDLITQFNKRGYMSICCDILTDWYWQCHSCLSSFFSAMEQKNNMHALIKEFVLKILSNDVSKEDYDHFVNFISAMMTSSIVWYDCMTNSMILKYTFAELVVNRNRYIFVKLLMDVALKTAETCKDKPLSTVTDFISATWKTHFFSMQSNVEQQLFVSYCLAGLISIMTKQEFENSETLRNCIEGIQQRLHSSNFHIRRSCALISLQMSKTINPKQSPLVLFDDLKDCLNEFHSHLSQSISANAASSIRKQHPSEGLSMTTGVNALNNKKQAKMSSNKREKKAFNPNALLIDDDDESSEDEQADNEELSDSTSVESLQSLEMSDDEGGGNDEMNPYKPYYVRDLIDFLFANDQDKDQMLKIEAALKFAVPVIEKTDPKILQLNAVHLCTALLTCSETHIHNYFTYRMDAMVSLLTKSCMSIVDLQYDKQDQRFIDFEDETVLLFLTTKFWSNQVTQAQRIDILTVLVKAAINLSNNNSLVSPQDLNSSQLRKEALDQKSSQEQSTSSLPPPQYPPNTKRWGSALNPSKRKQIETRPNYFLLHANRFYYMLLRTKSKVSETIHIMFGEDNLVLSKIVHTLGVFLFCCGTNPAPLVAQQLGKNTLEFLWTLILHCKDVSTSNNLRLSVLGTLNTAISCCTSTILLEELLVDIHQVFDWLLNTSDNDSHLECREMAKMVLSTLSSKMKI
ncbi:hypothetical protein C9374_008750 [Naegleria lovaniensis]|uniref:Telomere length regulation protein conserved domain-containing protein n=1 Tax=Naegleria lovaniensis TaxID=51637 RepID=A0AA88GL29_NAELO|nr:uncharacterized protein C9374_008750 [Naegleria lovaniensis]KAG2378128.1 hypothetical protein C9374_008750 [Naegleria lovaniensis]